MIRIVPKAPCMNARDDWAAVVNSPFRNYNALYVDASYGITAKEAVGAMNPRNFSFVVTCGDFKVEGHRLEVALWPYSYSKGEAEAALAKLGTSQLGKAQFTILHSKVSEAAEDVEGKNYGKIDWMRFDVDFALPLPRVGHGQLGGLK